MKYMYAQRGYTLFETVTYVALFSILSVVAINAIVVVVSTFADVRADRAINHTAISALDRMVREIRLAEQVDTEDSVFDTSPGSLSLSSVDSNGYAITRSFYIEDGRIHTAVDDVSQGAITSDSIVIDTLTFRLTKQDDRQAVRMEVVIYDNRSSEPKKREFYNTATLRGTY